MNCQPCGFTDVCVTHFRCTIYFVDYSLILLFSPLPATELARVASDVETSPQARGDLFPY